MTMNEKLETLIDQATTPTPEFCIASKARGYVVDLLRADGLTRIYGESLEQVRARPGYEDAEVMPVEEWQAWKAAQQDTPIRWEQVSERRYDDALEVLPPLDWNMKAGFLVREPYDHHALTGRARYQAYRRIGAAFFVSSRPITRHEWRAILTGGEA